ncbi:hypothetical protein [Streptacidiphilus cavernicola]|uniref:Uncharacterized protein n=1 Tax=Streptacidiphilus cavernicola TaxID=3342716 RepID=A0ABV6W251_9ACTN
MYPTALHPDTLTVTVALVTAPMNGCKTTLETLLPIIAKGEREAMGVGFSAAGLLASKLREDNPGVPDLELCFDDRLNHKAADGTGLVIETAQARYVADRLVRELMKNDPLEAARAYIAASRYAECAHCLGLQVAHVLVHAAVNPGTADGCAG